MSGKLFLQRRAHAASLASAVFVVFAAAPAGAQDCPAAQSGKEGFVVQRGELQKTEIFHVDDSVVRTILRYNGTTYLETTQYQGLFQLDRLDRGKRTKYEPQTDLKALFPLKPGRTVTAAFTSESNGERGTLSVELTVKSADVIWIGPCKYSVLKIDRSESYNGGSPRFIDTDYYSPELRWSLAKEWRESGGGTHMNKYDRIYPLKPAGASAAPKRNAPRPVTSQKERRALRKPETEVGAGASPWESRRLNPDWERTT